MNFDFESVSPKTREAVEFLTAICEKHDIVFEETRMSPDEVAKWKLRLDVEQRKAVCELGLVRDVSTLGSVLGRFQRIRRGKQRTVECVYDEPEIYLRPKEILDFAAKLNPKRDESAAAKTESSEPEAQKLTIVTIAVGAYDAAREKLGKESTYQEQWNWFTETMSEDDLCRLPRTVSAYEKAVQRGLKEQGRNVQSKRQK